MAVADDGDAIKVLVAEVRAAREAVRTLVTRLQQERLDWQRNARILTRRARLTPSQRQRLRARLPRL